MRFGAAITSVAATLVVAACGSATTGGTTPRLDTRLSPIFTPQFLREKVAPERSSLRVIGADLLVPEAHRSLIDIVDRQWPTFLRPMRGPVGDGMPDLRQDIVGVYSGTAFLGGQTVLAAIPARQVLAAYRLSQTEEYARWGRMHPGGAIEVIWRSPSAPVR